MMKIACCPQPATVLPAHLTGLPPETSLISHELRPEIPRNLRRLDRGLKLNKDAFYFISSPLFLTQIFFFCSQLSQFGEMTGCLLTGVRWTSAGQKTACLPRRHRAVVPVWTPNHPEHHGNRLFTLTSSELHAS
jgi:hypothetical protein